MFINMLLFVPISENTKYMQKAHSKWWLNFVLSSRVDPVGDQDEVQYLPTFCYISILYFYVYNIVHIYIYMYI